MNMSDKPQEHAVHSVKVWDGPTRIFHWALAVVVIVDFFTGDDDIPEIIIHTYLGYIVGLLLIFRVAWSIVGSPSAGFSDLVKPWSETYDYIQQLIRLSPPRYVRHNPLGGLMILVMLAVLALIVVTGMAAAVDEGVVVPFFGDLPHWLAEAGGDIHEDAAKIMMVLVGIHVAGVIADTVLTGDNLVKSMITGHRAMKGTDAPATGVSVWRVTVLSLLLVNTWFWMIAETRF